MYPLGFRASPTKGFAEMQAELVHVGVLSNCTGDATYHLPRCLDVVSAAAQRLIAPLIPCSRFSFRSPSPPPPPPSFSFPFPFASLAAFFSAAPASLAFLFSAAATALSSHLLLQLRLLLFLERRKQLTYIHVITSGGAGYVACGGRRSRQWPSSSPSQVPSCNRTWRGGV
jgi:hypothetical protein